MFKSIPVFFLLIFSFLAYTQQLENVFVITIDGVRNDEGFEAESLNLRHIWNDLRPQGTIYRRFWNRGWTATTAGHNTIGCGVRQIVRNTGGTAQDIRPDQPTFFEYFRSTFGLPESAIGALMGKGNARCVDFSLEPSYGENYKGFISYGANDTTVSNWVHQTMDSIHPRLLYINLREVDQTGHGGIYDTHLFAIKIADSIVYEFWKHIQAIPPYTDSFYQNKTVMIVTTDHGRNDDAHGSFFGHGEWDHGCRDLIFLAIGPGIKQNTVIDNIDRDHIDIVPTVGYILGFPTPLAEGDIMTEMFLPSFRPNQHKIIQQASPLSHEWNLSNNTGFSREPDMTIDQNGTIHLVWIDKTRGEWEVYYRKSTNQGLTWSPIQILFDFPGKDSVMWFANISGDDSLIVSAMGYAKVAQVIDSLPPSRIESTFVWYPWIATSINAGDNWHITSMLDSNMGSYASPVAVKNGRYSIAYWMVGKFGYERTQEGLNFNWRNPSENWQDSVSRIINKKFLNIKLIDDGTSFHIVGSCIQTNDEDWEIGYWRSENGLDWNRVWITKDSSIVFYDYDPLIVKDDSGNLHLVWARKPNIDGSWQIQYCNSTDTGNTWSTMTQITSSPVSACKPQILSRNDTVFVFWQDYRNGEPKIYYKLSPDLGLTWTTEEPIAGVIARNVSVAIDNNRIYLTWQDYQDGNWEIYFKYLPYSLLKHDVGPAYLVKPQTRTLPDDSIIPQAMIRNYGDVFETFKTYLWIEPAYLDSTVVTVAPEDSGIAIFSQTWDATFGSYPFKVYTVLNTDQNLTNDTVTGVIEVIGDSWIQLEDVPLEPRNKKVKAGGSLVYVPDQNLIYAFKGNNTNEFFAYSLSTGNWIVKESIPYDPNGRRKRVKRGGALCYDGSRFIYATKGKNTTEFWRYDTKSDIDDTIWKMLPSVPILPSGKKVKGGTGLVFVTKGSDQYAYLLKGSKTTDFYAYHIQGDSWLLGLPPAPLGPLSKPFKYGSCMIQVMNNLYALKSYYNEFYRYDLLADTWEETPISVMPFYNRIGKRKKVKDGSALCYDGIDKIYAFKGGNTQEFWVYSISGDTWIQKVDLPLEPSRRKVKSGGALTFAQGKVFGLKGSNTREFWMYSPVQALYLKANTEKLNIFTIDRLSIHIPEVITTPNPSSDILKIRYTLINSNNLNITIFDVSGRIRRMVKVTNKSGLLELPLIEFNSGIYFIRFETENKCYNQKLVIR